MWEAAFFAYISLNFIVNKLIHYKEFFIVLCFGSIKIFNKYPCVKWSRKKKELGTIVWSNIFTSFLFSQKETVRTVKSFFKGIWIKQNHSYFFMTMSKTTLPSPKLTMLRIGTDFDGNVWPEQQHRLMFESSRLTQIVWYIHRWIYSDEAVPIMSDSSRNIYWCIPKYKRKRIRYIIRILLEIGCNL